MFKSGNGGSMDGIPALTANKAVVTNGVGSLTTSVTTDTEISYVSGVTSSIQTQLNSKQPTGNYITGLTGDVAATGPGSVTATLATVNGAPGSFGGASKTLTATVNAKGLVTAMAETAIAIASSQVTGTFPFSDITGTVPINQGGTGQITANAGFNALSPMTTIGDTIYGGASGAATRLAGGTTGQFLGANTGAAPSWKNVTASYSVNAKTANYTITSSDTIVRGDASAGGFTFTMPSPVGFTGQITLVRSDNTLGNIISISATGLTGKTLATQNESWTLASDNTNWIVVNHTCYTPVFTWTPTFAALGTVSNVAASGYREGINFVFNIRLTAGTPTGSIVTGTFPSGLTTAANLIVDLTTGYMVTGIGNRNINNVNVITVLAPVSSTLFYIGGYTASMYTPAAPQSGTDFTLAGDNILLSGKVPMTNWSV